MPHVERNQRARFAPPRARTRGAWAGLVLAATAALLPGCAVGSVGAVVGSVQTVRGGWLMDVYTVGLHVRPSLADDLGATLGVARRSYVFAAADVPAPASGWYVFHTPWPDAGRAVVRHVETYGIDLHLSEPEAGLTVGMQQLTASRPERIDAGHFRHVVYLPDAPELTCVSTHWERPC